MESISAVFPAYNDGGTIGQLVEKTYRLLESTGRDFEIVVVDDGSKDNTAEVIRQLCEQHREVVGLNLSRNFGKEAALTAGIDAARGEVVVLMDADGQHPVSLVAEMVQRWRQGADVVGQA